MKRKGLILASILIMMFYVNSFAQEQQDENWRDYEVSINAGMSMPSGALKDWYDSLGAKSGMNVGISGGRYLNAKTCLGVYFSLIQFPIENKDFALHYNLYDIGAYAKYAFADESNFEPYVKMKLGADFAKFATWVGPNKTTLRELSYGAGLTLGVAAGAMYYTSDVGGLFVELGYNMAKLKDNEVEYGNVYYKLQDDVSHLDVKAGITVFFGKE
jgi:hypothetical protein